MGAPGQGERAARCYLHSYVSARAAQATRTATDDRPGPDLAKAKGDANWGRGHSADAALSTQGGQRPSRAYMSINISQDMGAKQLWEGPFGASRGLLLFATLSQNWQAGGLTHSTAMYRC